MAAPKSFWSIRNFAGVIAEALTLMKGPKPIVIDVDDAAFVGGKRIGEIEYEAAVAQGDPGFAARPPGDEWDAIALSYTSGTTGNPKGVVTHHRGAYLNAVSNILAGNLGQHPVYLWTLPMFHCNGWCFPWTIAATAGINVCLRKVDPAKIFELIPQHDGDVAGDARGVERHVRPSGFPSLSPRAGRRSAS